MATENNTAPAATTEAAPMTKMDHSRILFAEIYAPGYKLKMEGAKSQRSEFVKRAMAEFGATKNGAATYFQNLSNEAKGQPLYKYSAKKKDVQTAEGQLNQTTDTAAANLPKPEAADNNNSVAEGEPGAFRWTCVNEADEEVASFPIRKSAQEYAKQNNLKQGDRNIKAKAE